MAIEFRQFKKQMQDAFVALIKNQTHLYVVPILPDELWDTYINSFTDPVEKQSHTCSACKSFIRHYGNIVALVDGKAKSIWDFQSEGSYEIARKALADKVAQYPIYNVFFSKFAKLGVDFNTQLTENQGVIKWNHFYIELPRKFVITSSDSIESLMGHYRDNRNVFKRALEEISIETLETVLELIAQGSLYRGDEFKGALTEFLKYKRQYSKVEDKENYTWQAAVNLPASIAKIRNSAIGTLLIDITEGKELDYAVTAFERMMAPANYKRPTAIVTKAMVERAEKEIEELGLTNSLGRRLANPEDISVNNLLFVDRDAKKGKGIFAEMKDDAPVNPKSLSKIDEVTIGDFLEKILPTAKGIEVLFENHQMSNFVTLVTAKNENAPTLFKWPNPFSWSYTNGLTDSIKEKVKAAGGKVDGELRVSLAWQNTDDLDLHVYEPSGYHIYFGDRRSPTNGELDVDMNVSSPVRDAVENVIWPSQVKIKEGRYRVVVNNYNKRESADSGFSIEIECQGQTLTFASDKSPANGQSMNVVEFEYSKKDGVKVITGNQSASKTVSKEKWNISSNKFHKVSMIMNSPNYWDGKTVGNSHIFFILEGVKSDEPTRGFFNEFLRDDLTRDHKRVFEVLANKLKVEPADKEVSGLGFSSTQRNSLIVKVQGNFERILKINF